ncbi:hypothetical protein [Streptomyces sp. URMC 124]|uniref:hypothetical protein n=1 Tax=Streptomyces sp. URMC 124 TaxID=3423405 RepID=UPI003F19A7B5
MVDGDPLALAIVRRAPPALRHAPGHEPLAVVDPVTADADLDLLEALQVCLLDLDQASQGLGDRRRKVSAGQALGALEQRDVVL